MTMQVTTWKPDTCGCEIEYQWDDSVSQDNRTHSLKVIKPCAIHASDPHPTAYQNVLNENQSKNLAIELLVKSVPKLEEKKSEIKFRFEADRSIVLSHPELNSSDKNILKDVKTDNLAKKVSFE